LQAGEQLGDLALVVDAGGVGAWRIDAGRFVVVYDHPHGEDIDAVRIISAWPKRRPRRRHLRGLS
jgi:hypothetical protein